MPIQGGLAAMLADSGASKDLVKSAKQIEEMPGGPELLYTHAAEEMMGAMGIPKKDAKKVRLFNLGGYAEAKEHYARGGATKTAAQRTRKAGRGDDSMMLHMSPEEYEVITSMWGEPEINPKTGIGEYGFLSKIWKKIKKGVKKIVKSQAFQIIAPIALSIFVPGIGAAIGGALAPAAAAGTQAMIGGAVVNAGLGAMSGGKEGAIKGAISGAVGAGAGKLVGSKIPGLSGKTADVVGSALLSGAGAEVTGGDFASGALSGGLGAYTRGATDEFSEAARAKMGLEAKPGSMFASRIDPNAPQASTQDFGSYSRPATEDDIMGGAAEFDTELGAYKPVETQYTEADYNLQQETGVPGAVAPPPAATAGAPASGADQDLLMKYGLPILTAMGAMQGSGEEGEPPELPESFRGNLPVYQMDRKFQGLPGQDYYTYGQAGAPQSGQHLFITPSDPFAGERGSGSPLDPGDPSEIGGGMPGMEASPPGGVPRGARGVQTADIAAGERIQIEYGRTGVAQRQKLESNGWYDGGDGYYYPPEETSFTGARGGLAAALGGYWDQNQDALQVSSRSGGYTKGPGSGRSDDIEARLSDGEYVIDAESVSLLGDGSGDEGARRLDEMRTNLRKHKGKNFKKGEFSHKAKPPARYMSNVKKLRRKAQHEHGGLHNVAVGGTI